MYIDYYERNYIDYNEAAQTAAATNGNITTFISTDEAGQPITIYCARYPQLF